MNRISSLRRSGAVSALVLVAGTLLATGCSNLSSTQTGAAIGAATGAVLGGVLDDHTARGAILGAVIGGAAGAAIGHLMDDQAEDLQDRLPNAKVERVGEGIQVTFDSGILFAFDSSNLSGAARENLQSLAVSLEDYPGTNVMVVGHTDSSGADTYNQRLSERRAEAARTFLVQQGLETDRVLAQGRGESEPVASEATAEGAQANRRVEVAIYASEEMQQEMLRRHGG